jgi:hypothetical protein
MHAETKKDLAKLLQAISRLSSNSTPVEIGAIQGLASIVQIDVDVLETPKKKVAKISDEDEMEYLRRTR